MDKPSRHDTLREIMRPMLAKVLVGLPVAASLYQFACDQFGAPTLPKVWGMTGAAFPWWGWLLVAQAGFVYALFEYVRRTPERQIATVGQLPPQPSPRSELGGAESSKTTFTAAERERLSRALIATEEYLADDLAKVLAPLVKLLHFYFIMQDKGAHNLLTRLEGASQGHRLILDNMRETLNRYSTDLGLLGIEIKGVCEKADPVYNRISDLSHVLLALPPDTKNPGTINVLGEAYGKALGEFRAEIEIVRHQIAQARQRIARGEIG